MTRSNGDARAAIQGGRVTADDAERAREAVKRMQRMAPGLQAFARALTRDPKLTLKVDAGQPRTDGKTIFLRPPIELGTKMRHDTPKCGQRDAGLTLECEACRVIDEIEATLYHEIAHIAYDSFAALDEQDKLEIVRRAVEEGNSSDPDAHGARVAARVERENPTGYMDAATIVSPYMPVLINALEDARVNTEMYRARPGTYKMFKGHATRVFEVGQLQDDGTHLRWDDAPRNMQVLVGVYAKAAGYDYSGWFSDEVTEALNDATMTRLVGGVAGARSTKSIYRMAFPILEHLRTLGFCKKIEEQEQDEIGSEDGTTGAREDNDDADTDPDSEPEQGDQGPESRSVPEDDSEPQQGPSQSEAGESPDGEDGHGEQGDEPDGETGSGDSDSDESGDGAGSENGDAQGGDEGEPDDGDDSSQEGGQDGAPGDEAGDAADDDTDAEGDAQGGDEDTAQAGDHADGGDDGQGADGEDDDELAHGDTEDYEDADDADSDDDDHREQRSGFGGEDGAEGARQVPEDGDDAEQGEKSDRATNEAGDDMAGTPDEGTPEACQQGLEQFGGHTRKVATEEARQQDLEIDRAIVQGDVFDEPSQEMFGVNVHRWNDQNTRAQRCGWRPEYDPSQVPLVDETIIMPALARARVVFSDNKKARKTRNLKGGRINARALGKRVPVGDPRIFQKKIEPGAKDYFVLIGLDNSGSTGGYDGPLGLIKQAGLAKAELLHRLGIPFAMYAHNGFPHHFHTNESVKHRGGAIMDLDIVAIKEPEEPWGPEQRERLRCLSSGGYNLDGHAMEFYRKVAERQRATDKIVLYYTDGEMPAANYDDELVVLQREIRNAPRRGVTIVGVGVGTDSPRTHGLDTIRLDAIEDVGRVVHELESRIVKRVL